MTIFVSTASIGRSRNLRGYGYDPGPEAGWFPSTRHRPETDAEDARRAWENRPSAVFGEIALMLVGTAAFVTFICSLLKYLHVS